MDKDEIKRFVDSLLTFIERASKEGAAGVEVEALPAVAHVLAELLRDF